MQRRKYLIAAMFLLLVITVSGLVLFGLASIKNNGSRLSSEESLGGKRYDVSPFRPHHTLLESSRSLPVTQSAAARDAYGALPLSLEPNQGQAPEDVKFLSLQHGYTLFLTSTEAVLQLPTADSRLAIDSEGHHPAIDDLRLWELAIPLGFHRFAKVADDLNQRPVLGNRPLKTIRMKFVGSDRKAKVEGVDKLPGICNYLIGNNPKKWRTNIPTYRGVRCKDVYPGIDLVYSDSTGHLEYDFEIRPGADPSLIQLAFEGADQTRLEKNGDLVLVDGSTEIRQHKPRLYQQSSKSRRLIEGYFAMKGQHEVGFQVGEYDQSLALLIDPEVVFSTSLGGHPWDAGLGIAVDPQGRI